MDIGHVLKSGYLTKLDRVSQRSWKKRYFVLTDTQIGYYESQEDLSKPKGTMLLFNDCTVQRRPKGELMHTFVITTPYTELHVSASSDEEVEEWVDALTGAFEKLKPLPRDTLTKKGGFFDGTKPRYVIMHSSALTFHEDSSKVKVVLGTMPLEDCYLEFVENASISLTRGRENWVLLFDGTEHSANFTKWKVALQDQIKANVMAQNAAPSYATPSNAVGSNAADADVAALSLTGAAANGTVSALLPVMGSESAEKDRLHACATVRTEELLMRPQSGGDVWEPHTVHLSNTYIEILRSDGGGKPKLVCKYPISLSCAAFETNLGPFAFEVVTPLRILHLRAVSKEALAEWVRCIREVIVSSRADPSDPLFHSAMLKIATDDMYEAVFPEQKPLGVVLERAGEWGIVLKANNADTQISVGSVLTAVNGQSVVLNNYMETIGLLKGWKPPLRLLFRRAPQKEGWLMKQSTGKSKKSAVVKNWKRRFFVLANGRLLYREDSATGSSVKGDLPLMGSAVSLVSSQESKRLHCFRLVSGVTSLVMQASNAEELMDWAATLHHASFIANGGNHIVGLQRARAAQEARREQEAEERVEAQRVFEAGLAEAQLAHEETVAAEVQREAVEKDRRAALQAEEREQLEAADRARALCVLQLNTELDAARVALQETKPFQLAVLQRLQSALEAARAQPGCDEVVAKKAEFAFGEAGREKGGDIEVLRLMQDALIGGSAAALTHALAEADFVEGFESEQAVLVGRVNAALVVAKTRETVVVELQLAVDGGEAHAVRDCYAEALRRRVHPAESVLAAARTLLEAAGVQVPEPEPELEEAAGVPVPTLSCPGSPVALGSPEVGAMEAVEDEFENHNDSEDEEEDEEEEEPVADTEGATDSGVGASPIDGAIGPDSQDGASDFATKRAAFGGGAVTSAGTGAGGLSYQEVIRRNKAKNDSRRRGLLEQQKARRVYDEAAPDPALATDAVIRKLFQSYCKAVEGMDATRGEFLNPMQFSSILRLVTEEKSNLFKEMQMFKR